jgi:hypothetical protein
MSGVNEVLRGLQRPVSTVEFEDGVNGFLQPRCQRRARDPGGAVRPANTAAALKPSAERRDVVDCWVAMRR